MLHRRWGRKCWARGAARSGPLGLGAVASPPAARARRRQNRRQSVWDVTTRAWRMKMSRRAEAAGPSPPAPARPAAPPRSRRRRGCFRHGRGWERGTVRQRGCGGLGREKSYRGCKGSRAWGFVGRGAEQLILTWQGRYHDHEGGFPRARLIHCTPDVLTPAISPNVGNSTA